MGRRQTVTSDAEAASERVWSSVLRDPRTWLIAAVIFVAAVGVVVAVYLGRRGPSLAAAKLPPISVQPAGPTTLKADVASVSGSTLQLDPGGGSRSTTVGPDTRVEALLPMLPKDVKVGDFITVGGVPNFVYSFAVKLVVDIPPDAADPNASNPPRSRSGFDGWETYRDANQLPEVFGKVESIDAGGIHLNGALGPITVKLDDQSPLKRLTAGGVELIHGGDHVALAGPPAAPTAILVLPGG
jgi:hypothetical protein